MARTHAAGVAVGDLCVVDGAGAYCSSMSTKNYNSFPEAAEARRDRAEIAPRCILRPEIVDAISGRSRHNLGTISARVQVMVDTKGEAHLIRRRQPLEQIWANEVPYKG